MRLKNRKAATYLINLTVRRLVFVGLGLVTRNVDDAGLQWVLVMIFATLLPQINGLAIGVNLTLSRNRLEIFNEWICGTAVILAHLYTNVYSAEQRYEYGWLLIFVTCLGLLVNAALMLYEMVNICHLSAKR